MIQQQRNGGSLFKQGGRVIGEFGRAPRAISICAPRPPHLAAPPPLAPSVALATPHLPWRPCRFGSLFRGLATSCGREGLFTAGYLGIGPVFAERLRSQYDLEPKTSQAHRRVLLAHAPSRPSLLHLVRSRSSSAVCRRVGRRHDRRDPLPPSRHDQNVHARGYRAGEPPHCSPTHSHFLRSNPTCRRRPPRRRPSPPPSKHRRHHRFQEKYKSTAHTARKLLEEVGRC